MLNIQGVTKKVVGLAIPTTVSIVCMCVPGPCLTSNTTSQHPDVCCGLSFITISNSVQAMNSSCILMENAFP